ncbi:MAG: uroporphyrinogen-III C-methyltransferase [Chloroflexi bacterium]|nr:uroporphyrinogen-III C-methyltransferase [Chloroflexota bacterium]
MTNEMNKKARVYFVGAGPGDPGLLTLRGRECLARAEVIIYDRLLDPRMLEQFPPGAEAIYAGKSSGAHSMTQEQINELIVAKASPGKIVVRLKGGDPFVFGRGGEEAETVRQAGIPYEIVPGVTAAIAVPSYAGIPVTHRSLASSVAIVTGHEDPTKDGSAIRWKQLTTATDTLVFLMGVENLAEIAGALIKNGLPASTPAAVIANGASPHQATVTATIADIASEIKKQNIGPPAVLVVGQVVSLREKLQWFETLPLFGRTVLVTRARHQASALSRLLAEEGAMPVEFPVIGIEAIENNPKLDHALSLSGEYSWIIFTSANAVAIFFRRLRELGRDSRALAPCRIGAVGPATAEELGNYGIVPDFIPGKFTSEAVGAQIPVRPGEKVLLPRAMDVTEDLARELARKGAVVVEIPVYRNVPPAADGAALKELLKNSKVDVVTFTSSSTVHGLVSLLGGDRGKLEGLVTASIGPVTSATARELGLNVTVEAAEHTIPGLVEAIKEYYAK